MWTRPPAARTSSSRTRYTFPIVTHFAIEPHAFMAAPDGDGIAVWSSIQHPNWLQTTISKLLGMSLAKVRVYAPDPGGGFGGKQHAKYEPLVAFAALRAGRPVRLILSLDETFQAVAPHVGRGPRPDRRDHRRNPRVPGHRRATT